MINYTHYVALLDLVDLKVIVRLERLRQFTNPMSSSGIELCNLPACKLVLELSTLLRETGLLT
jgi:hypothetical protein